MKVASFLLCLFTLCVSQPLRGEEACCASIPTVQQRLMEIDMRVFLTGYEQIKSTLMESQIRLTVLRTDPKIPAEEKERSVKLLVEQIEALRSEADSLRAQILQLGKELQVASK